jgi:hypothetical protein
MNAPERVNNTELREAPPDVDAYEGPLKGRCLALVERLAAGAITVDAYQHGAAAIFADSGLGDELASSIARALDERKDQVFYRKQEGPRRHDAAAALPRAARGASAALPPQPDLQPDERLRSLSRARVRSRRAARAGRAVAASRARCVVRRRRPDADHRGLSQRALVRGR